MNECVASPHAIIIWSSIGRFADLTTGQFVDLLTTDYISNKIYIYAKYTIYMSRYVSLHNVDIKCGLFHYSSRSKKLRLCDNF